MRIVALIPARGGSKRLPYKNIVQFCGRPLIEWTIRFAIRSGVFVGIYVSTEDKMIAKVSTNAGASIIDRPERLASDKSSTADAIHHAYSYLSSIICFDWVCILQPTSPLRPEFLMMDAVEQIPELKKNESMMTVTTCKHKIGRITSNGYFESLGYELGQRSQDINFFCYENGLMYLTPAKLVKTGRIFGYEVFPIETSPIYNLDIDDCHDLRLGEFMFEQNKEHFAYLF